MLDEPQILLIVINHRNTKQNKRKEKKQTDLKEKKGQRIFNLKRRTIEMKATFPIKSPEKHQGKSHPTQSTGGKNG
jgi:hypothetical protein